MIFYIAPLVKWKRQMEKEMQKETERKIILLMVSASKVLYLSIYIALLSAWAFQKCSRLKHWYCVRVNMPKRYRQLQVKDLPEVLTWRLEWDLNLRPSGRKIPNPTTESPRHRRGPESKATQPLNDTLFDNPLRSVGAAQQPRFLPSFNAVDSIV